ncbi:MAG: hypothetical protein HYU64_17060 [Armatimonadetes bacterium]|nr:hypothetical protein [Armatimonadota bacterium]
MSSITVQRPVVIKVIMTESFRTQLVGEAQETIKRIEESLKQMETTSRDYIKTIDLQNPQQGSILASQLESEKERLHKMRGELEWRIKEVEGVEEGVELPFRVFEGPVPLIVGDNFLDKVTRAEVVIKDWQVVEIRG